MKDLNNLSQGKGITNGYPERSSQFRMATGLLLTLLVSSCGSVHQMIPPVPLERNKFGGSVVISYDFNRFAPASSIGMNFYWGAGKDYNLGFGYQPPLGISHLTAVKYFNADRSGYENLYVSANGIIFTTDYSPNFEIGGNYIAADGRAYQSLNLGIWTFIDDEKTEPVWKALLLPSTAEVGFHPRLHLCCGYSFAGRDFRFAIKNNIGLTNRIISYQRNKLDNREPIYFTIDEISYVKFNYFRYRLDIQPKDSTRFEIARIPYPDFIFNWIDRMRLEKFTPQDSLRYYYISEFPVIFGYPEKRVLGLYELNFDQILSDYVGKQDILIAPNPARTTQILEKIHWYKHDWSIAVGSSRGNSMR